MHSVNHTASQKYNRQKTTCIYSSITKIQLSTHCKISFLITWPVTFSICRLCQCWYDLFPLITAANESKTMLQKYSANDNAEAGHAFGSVKQRSSGIKKIRLCSESKSAAWWNSQKVATYRDLWVMLMEIILWVMLMEIILIVGDADQKTYPNMAWRQWCTMFFLPISISWFSTVMPVPLWCQIPFETQMVGNILSAVFCKLTIWWGKWRCSSRGTVMYCNSNWPAVCTIAHLYWQNLQVCPGFYKMENW